MKMVVTISHVMKARKLIFANVIRRDLDHSTGTLKMAWLMGFPIKFRTL